MLPQWQEPILQTLQLAEQMDSRLVLLLQAVAPAQDLLELTAATPQSMEMPPLPVAQLQTLRQLLVAVALQEAARLAAAQLQEALLRRGLLSRGAQTLLLVHRRRWACLPPGLD